MQCLYPKAKENDRVSAEGKDMLISNDENEMHRVLSCKKARHEDKEVCWYKKGCAHCLHSLP